MAEIRAPWKNIGEFIRFNFLMPVRTKGGAPACVVFRSIRKGEIGRGVVLFFYYYYLECALSWAQRASNAAAY